MVDIMKKISEKLTIGTLVISILSAMSGSALAEKINDPPPKRPENVKVRLNEPDVEINYNTRFPSILYLDQEETPYKKENPASDYKP